MEQLALFLLPVLIGLGVLSVWVVRLLKRDEQMRASLAAAVERNNLLMREIHHRTKNNLQSVASLIKLQPISEEAKAAMTARIAAMSALHEQAYRSDQYSDVNLRDYLLTLVDNIRKTSPDGIAIRDGVSPRPSIDRDLAQPLGLIVNEVISNAMKHAFAGRRNGRIAVTLALLAGRPRRTGRSATTARASRPRDSEQAWAAGSSAPLPSSSATTIPMTRENGTRFAIRFAAKHGAAEHMTDDYFAQNRLNWDDRAAIHIKDEAGGYRLDAFLAGADNLHDIEHEEIGDVARPAHRASPMPHRHRHAVPGAARRLLRGPRLLAQRHRRGTHAAAARPGLDASFVEGNVYDARAADRGLTSTWSMSPGAPSAGCRTSRRWAEVVASLLKPGGRLYLLEGHPSFMQTRRDGA